MKYEKATAEVLIFIRREAFMVISKGEVCEKYGTIEQDNDVVYSCFEFYLGSPRPLLEDYLSKCDDVTSPGGSCPEISCKYVIQRYGQNVT